MSIYHPDGPDRPVAPLANVLDALQAAGEITRLRLLALLAEAELTVSELVIILGQSQPRISRHLKLLVEAGMVDRHREGAWAFFHLAQSGPEVQMARNIVQRMDPNDPLIASDRIRLEEVRAGRADRAARYFAAQAANWDKIRSLHVPEEQVEAAIRKIVGDGPLQAVLDLGTGTGRMLEILAPIAVRAVGVDFSPAMLNVARAVVERSGLRNVQLRQGDLYALPVEADSYNLVILHQVLHYLDDPGRALREAARALRPSGRLLVVDFAPHSHEFLREEHEHRRLGFAADEVAAMLREADLDIESHRNLTPAIAQGGKLTVSIWVARDRRVITDIVPRSSSELA